jgi:uncharacterized protein YkwD
MRLALALALLMATAAPAQQLTVAPDAVARIIPTLVQAINAARAGHGLPPLARDTALDNAAGYHAQDMARHGYLDHRSRDGRSSGERMRAAGYAWCMAAENIAFGQEDVTETVAAWLRSRAHRENILNPDATHSGAAFAVADGRPYWVAVFAAPC